MDKIETAILDLSNALSEKGITLEHIKISAPLEADGKTIKTLQGIEFKTVIYEDDATHWRRMAVNE